MVIFYVVTFFFGIMAGSVTASNKEKKILREYQKQVHLYMKENKIPYPPELEIADFKNRNK